MRNPTAVVPLGVPFPLPTTKEQMNRIEPKTVVLLGIPFHDVTMDETLAEIDRIVFERTPRYIVTANLDFAAQASRDVELQRILLDAHLVLCDGTPLVWTSRWLKAPLRERVAGSDLTPRLAAHAAERGYRLFFLGSNEAILAQAKAKLEAEYPGLNICGVYAPPYARLLDLDCAVIAEHIRAARPDILLVALGAPKQEKWISMHYRDLQVPCSIGIGASLDFVAGKYSRAPVWMQRSGLEWVYRLIQEPRRLLSRYAFDLNFFARALAAQAWYQRERSGAKLEIELAPEAAELAVYRWSGRADAAAVVAGRLPVPEPVGGQAHVLLDLAGVTFIDSTGLGLMLKGFKKCKKAGGALVLLCPGKVVLDLVATLNLTRLLPVAWTPDKAREAARMASAELHPECQARGGAVLVRCRGELTASGAVRLLELVEKECGSKDVRLDLAELHFIDSAGLQCLLRLRKIAEERGGGLTIAGANENVRNVLALAKLDLPLDVTPLAA